VRRSDGTTFAVEGTDTPVFGEDGGFVGAIGILRDVTERKEAEEALRSSEAEIFTVLESITDGFFALDNELRFTYVNSQAEMLFSTKREDLVGEMLWEDSTFYPEFQRAMAEGRTATFEGYYPPREAWYSVRAYPSGSGLSVYFQDVTERKKAEERFRSLVRNASDVILIMGSDQIVRYVSPAVERVLGYKPEQVVGQDNFLPVHPDDMPRIERFIGEVMGSPGNTSSMELRLRHVDDSWRYVETTCTNLLGDLAVGGIVFNTRDITERKEAEEALRESERRFRAITQHSSDIVTLLGATGTIRYQSPSVERILGYGQAEMIGNAPSTTSTPTT
jgi:PAS domain S-box-containing protein